MGTFLAYTLKSAFCLILFYPAYRLLLSRETFHRFNRIALLTLLALSALLPLVTISGVLSTSSADITMPQALPTLQPQAMDAVQEVASAPLTTLSWAHALLWIYLLGCIVYACHQLISFVRLGSLIHKAKREPMPEYINIKERGTYVRLYVHDEELAPFSWMHLIVVSRKSLEESGRAILIHELATSPIATRGTCCWPTCACCSSGSTPRHGYSSRNCARCTSTRPTIWWCGAASTREIIKHY